MGKGLEAYDKGEYKGAIEYWLQAIDLDPTHVNFIRPLQLQMVEAYSKGGEHDKAIKLCEKHIEEGESLEGIWALGDAQQAADQYEESVRTMQKAVEMATGEDSAFKSEENTQKARKKLKEAQVALKQSKEKNYYKILGIQRNAKPKEIKKAYREMALKWHPDKVAEADKEKASTMFQDISEAYEVLSDEETRAKYDRGEQVFENQGGGGQRQSGGRTQSRFHVRYG